MKKIVYRILLSVVAVLALSSSVAFLVLGRGRRDKIECKGISVTVMDSSLNHFVTGKDVENYVRSGYGKVVGLPVPELELGRIEEAVKLKSAVLTCEAYILPDGMLMFFLHLCVLVRRNRSYMRISHISERIF